MVIFVYHWTTFSTQYLLHLYVCCFPEFMPYVFQMLSLLIELHSGRIPETYIALFPHLLAPVLWERPGNIPPLVRLLQAFIEKGSRQIEPDKLVSLHG